jgi:hypothetical protein
MAKAKHELTSQEAFVAACRAGKLSAIEQAMQGADLDGAARVVGSFPMTPLAAAAISGNPKVVEFRLARGASIRKGGARPRMRRRRRCRCSLHTVRSIRRMTTATRHCTWRFVAIRPLKPSACSSSTEQQHARRDGAARARTRRRHQRGEHGRRRERRDAARGSCHLGITSRRAFPPSMRR